ncbi:heterokaryon incompatibility protein-domain-containing protein [Lophiotrema nucula]|uniref:Heterokaryon incompatibility protein-domain-containing protein n=1 Tax=Lophiotrema nucula TaxID=690887 RepID=A0A6A5Z094_9PLEO|nr:heterokaryon incompatibility protein-domain-containing protein [Lophiotrema nucula]
MLSRYLRLLRQSSSPKHQTETSTSTLPIAITSESTWAQSCSECSRLNLYGIFQNGKYSDNRNEDSLLIHDRRPVEVLLSSDGCQLCHLVIDIFVKRGLLPKNAKEVFANVESGRTVVYGPHRLTKYTGALKIRLELTDAPPFDNYSRLLKDEVQLDTIILYPEKGSNWSNQYSGRVVPELCDLALIQSWLPVYPYSWDQKVFDTYALRSLRLIDLELLCVREVELPEQYAALSYVWGPPSTAQLRLFKDDVSAWSMPGSLARQWDHIPTTIRDAMKVCGECSIPFLWVDALCFVQDAEDMQEQLNSVTEIYGLAFVTIVAAWGSSSWSGLRGVSVRRELVQQRARVGYYSLIEALPSVTPEFQAAPWSHRGWTSQEHLFSSRCLLFLENRILYQNLAKWLDESIDFSYTKKYRYRFEHLPRLALFNDFGDDGFSAYDATLDTFYNFVESYFALQLTHAEDILNACQGTMAWFGRACGYQFLWATPTNDLHQGLTFRVSNQQRRPGFPSWSWLGWRILDNYDAKSIDFNRHQNKTLIIHEPPPPYVYFTIDPTTDAGNPVFTVHESESNASTYEAVPPTTPSMLGLPSLTATEQKQVLIFESWIVDLTNTAYGAKLSATSQAALSRHRNSNSHDNALSLSFALVPISAYVIPQEMIEFPMMIVYLLVAIDDRGVSERIEIEELEFKDWNVMEQHKKWMYLV